MSVLFDDLFSLDAERSCPAIAQTFSAIVRATARTRDDAAMFRRLIGQGDTITMLTYILCHIASNKKLFDNIYDPEASYPDAVRSKLELYRTALAIVASSLFSEAQSRRTAEMFVETCYMLWQCHDLDGLRGFIIKNTTK